MLTSTLFVAQWQRSVPPAKFSAAGFSPLSTAGWMEIAIGNPPLYESLEWVDFGAVSRRARQPGSRSSIENARLSAQASLRAPRASRYALSPSALSPRL